MRTRVLVTQVVVNKARKALGAGARATVRVMDPAGAEQAKHAFDVPPGGVPARSARALPGGPVPWPATRSVGCVGLP